MDISVGKTYKITNKDKKTYYEEIEFKNENGDSLTKQLKIKATNATFN